MKIQKASMVFWCLALMAASCGTMYYAATGEIPLLTKWENYGKAHPSSASGSCRE